VVVEVAVRHTIVWRPAALVVGITLACLLPWRNRHPLATSAAAVGSLLALDVAALMVVGARVELNTAAFVLVFPYAVFRWGSGREAVIGAVMMSVAWLVSIWTNPMTVGDAIGGAAVVTIPAAVGAAVRAHATTRRRELDAARMRERERLARELHDSVAHHVSAIAVQAQAGQTVAATAPAAVLDALAAIEVAASQALAEMRTTVRALRDGSEDPMEAQPGVADMRRLATVGDGSVSVVIRLDGDLENLAAPVDLAVYRLAQEAVTNAVRHARRATSVEVRVEGDERTVRLTVTDDGEPTRESAAGYAEGFGLEGMRERVAVLGGTISMGPRRSRGWLVDVTLPREPGAS
jgi:signal transduction histidine kinase